MAVPVTVVLASKNPGAAQPMQGDPTRRQVDTPCQSTCGQSAKVLMPLHPTLSKQGGALVVALRRVVAGVGGEHRGVIARAARARAVVNGVGEMRRGSAEIVER